FQRANDAREPGRGERIGARRRATVVAARLEREVCRSAAGRFAHRLERAHFRVRLARALVPALGEDPAVAHDHAAHARIRRRRVAAALDERERAGHEGVVFGGEHCRFVVPSEAGTRQRIPAYAGMTGLISRLRGPRSAYAGLVPPTRASLAPTRE